MKDSLTILEVLENLNTLVEADSLEEIEVTEDGHFISHKEEVEGRDIYWTGAGANEKTLSAIKSTFRVIHKYLITFYRKMKESGDQRRMIDGINTIMVLVGEAEKKLEKFDLLFKERIPKLDEYQNLQSFYKNHVIKESFKEFSKEVTIPVPMAPATEEEWEKEFDQLLEEESLIDVGGVHLLNDIELVKNDHLYELFYMKNEAGHPFYTQELARNIKLACDFGEFAQNYFGEDPLLQIKNWEDKSVHILAKRILKSAKKSIEKFYKEALKYREVEIVALLQKAVTALLLAANPRTQIRQFSVKGSHLYYRDFQLFLRDILANREYQRFLLYTQSEASPFFVDCLNLIHDLAFHAFTSSPDFSEIEKALHEMTSRKKESKTKKLSQYLHEADAGIREVLAAHPSGPVFKALDLVREEEERKFDPLMLGNLPTFEGVIKMGGKEISILRIPCPTIQEYIDVAEIAAEFKAFLQACMTKKEAFHLLLFNFQDRTSWKEHARSKVIEEIARQAEFAQALTVVTFAKETEFYNQQGVYHDLDSASEFVAHFFDHLQDESTGYYFPPEVKKELFPTFAKSLLNTIWETFFDGKKRLGLRERLDFIEIAYNFFTLKILEIVPSLFLSFTSKDSLDAGGTSIIGLTALLALGHGRKWHDEEFEAICRTLFGPTLLHRERPLLRDKFERVVEMIRLLEEKKEFLSSFSSLFNKATLEAEPHFYKESGEE